MEYNIDTLNIKVKKGEKREEKDGLDLNCLAIHHQEYVKKRRYLKKTYNWICKLLDIEPINFIALAQTTIIFDIFLSDFERRYFSTIGNSEKFKKIVRTFTSKNYEKNVFFIPAELIELFCSCDNSLEEFLYTLFQKTPQNNEEKAKRQQYFHAMWCYFYPIALNGYSQRQSAKYEERGEYLTAEKLSKEDTYKKPDYFRIMYRKKVRYDTKNNIDQYNAPSSNVFSLGDVLDDLEEPKEKC